MAGGAVLVTSGCNAPLSALDPLGPSAAEIGLLGRVMLAVMLTIWIGMVLLVLAVMSPRGRYGRVSLKTWLIGGGLVLPLAVMIPLFIWSVVLTGRLLPDGTEPTRIQVEGSMWAWTFTYPEVPGAASQGTLFLPAGQPVRLEITARDVIHSFWAPRLAGKMDAIPGHVNETLIQADNPGVIEGQCSEYCGQGHQLMRFVVDVRTPEDYTAALTALAEGRAPEPAPEWVPPSAVGAAAPSPPLPMPEAGGPIGGAPETAPGPDPMPPALPPSAQGEGSPAPPPEDIPTTIPRDSAP
ncbi:cytochrome c oxidase subunit II [Paracoccus sp. MC1854]|uniref:cytochrome c oxidase subunit II n=1 Tax=Paracoccus sp. MC1854 TaxID=2760306 RepID=UPI001600FEEA|nr:cytochrome c oxidase subunit II [Paracoccus sp. MC1854]MBB1490924.1 cytochrome c oxidase subunit II [Paracoccus sp. MC1854]